MDSKNNTVFPLEIKELESKLNAEVMEKFTGEHTDFVRVGPKGYLMPHKYKQEAGNIYNMSVRPTDIFVASYPRSGTTWTQELVWMVAKDLDYAGSDAVPLIDRYTLLESSVFAPSATYQRLEQENTDNKQKLKHFDSISRPGTEWLANASSPRFIKTHLPMSLLPPTLLDTGKMVYVARDPRDVVVSCYHFHKSNQIIGYVGDFKTYWQYFKNDLLSWSPYFENIKEAWNMRHHPNMLFLFYEELSKDLPAAVRKVASFLGKQYSEEQISRLCSHLSIESFRQNKSINCATRRELAIDKTAKECWFIRKGAVGGWRDYFVAELAADAQRWMDSNLRDTDFRFPHLHH